MNFKIFQICGIKEIFDQVQKVFGLFIEDEGEKLNLLRLLQQKDEDNKPLTPEESAG